MTLRLLYMLPMLLGRTYDARTNTIGIDIFPSEDINNPRTIPETFYGSSYKTIDSSSDVKDLLNIQGDFSLKIKGDAFDVKGPGSYLKNTLATENSVETLIKVTFRTYSVTLPSSATPVPHWKTIAPEFLGTHFIQSIIYGGDLIASVRFKALKSEYLHNIRGIVKASLETGSALQLVADGKLEMLEEKLKGTANVEVSYFATVPLEGVPSNISGLSELVKNFQHHVQKVNNGWGIPVEVDLGELSTFDTTIQHLRNSLLESELTVFEESFDDILIAKSRLKMWSNSLPIDLPREVENQIEDLRMRLSKTLIAFYEVISNLDMSKDVNQLEKATSLYKANGKSRLPGKFTRELNKLIKKTNLPSEKAPSRGSNVYIHYGKEKCALGIATSSVISGYVSCANRDTKGSGVNYICLPKNPTQRFEENDERIGNSDQGAQVQGVKFGVLEDTSLENEIALTLNAVVCVVCMTEERTSVIMIPDARNCPKDWIKEYAGYIMTSDSTIRSQNICVDESPDVVETESTRNDQTINIITKLEDGVVNDIPCVVCSK